jgi:hypothetical protein
MEEKKAAEEQKILQKHIVEKSILDMSEENDPFEK